MSQARRRTRRRLITAALSVAGHLALGLALLSVQAAAPNVDEDEPMMVQLVQAPPAPEPAKTEPAPAAATPEPEKPAPPRRVIVRPTPRPPPDVAPRRVREAKAAEVQSDGADQVSDAQLAGAGTAGSGGEGSGSGGGDCNMTRRLQSALRKDARVQAAVAEALGGSRSGGKAIMIWNGDWVRHGGQEGQGMAAVREAILWEVGFAPKACRAEPMRGLVLISLDDRPGSARLVVGSDQWRWSDILFRRSGARP